MNPILTKILTERYPLFFGKIKYAACGDGWFDILDILCSEIDNNYRNDVRNYEWKLEEYNQTDEEIAERIAKAPEHMHSQLQRPKEKPEKPVPLIITDIKEKYGTLRFYIMGGCDADDGAISMAESMSGRICDICGNPGKTNSGGWITCRCERCQGIIDKSHDPDNLALFFEKIEQEVIERVLKLDEELKAWKNSE